jgi:hypothetical protein
MTTDYTHLPNIPPPVDATDVDEWELIGDGKAFREFKVTSSSVRDYPSPTETILAVDGVQNEDGSTHRHIKLLISGHVAGPGGEWVDEPVEVARYGPDEARRIAARLLMAAERIEDTEKSELAPDLDVYDDEGEANP